MRTALLVLVMAGVADAHSLGLNATGGNGIMIVRVYYDDDTRAVGATVTVTKTVGGQVVATGITDASGQWTSPYLGYGHYKVRIDTVDGHAAARKVGIIKDESVSTDGPSQEEFVMTPWWGIGIGLGIIGGGFLLWRAARRKPAV